MTSVTNEAGTPAHVYNARGNVVQDTRVIGLTSYVTAYAYDLANPVVQVTYPSPAASTARSPMAMTRSVRKRAIARSGSTFARKGNLTSHCFNRRKASPASQAQVKGKMMIDRRLTIFGGLAGLTLAACGSAAPAHRDPLADISSGKPRVIDGPAKMWGHGLPAKGSFRSLLYNEPSQCLVAAFRHRFDAIQWSEDLYYRHRSSAEYLQIPGSNDQIHYNDVVSSANEPTIFFNVTRWNEIGGDWVSISSFNLTTSELRTELTEANLRDSESERVWVSSLISASDDASRVFCTVGFEKRIASDTSMVHYWLCEIRLTDFALTRLSLLPNTFA